jgi:predicted secreted hydrolase
MKSKWVVGVAIFALSAPAQQWRIASADYKYEFPRDHFEHHDFRTEWWYYTGNLRAAHGHRFGFELTFFRQAVHLPGQESVAFDKTWQPDQIYLAHLALTDIDAAEFYHTQRLNRAGPGLAGASFEQHRYWNGNWQVRWISPEADEQELQAVCDRFTLKLDLKPEKPFAINGRDGVSQKGPLPGEASQYLSFTRLRAAGQLQWKGTTFSLDGLGWMDHEFFTESDNNTLVGWDWFAIQLDNNEELMLYRLRTKSGVESPYSSGTYVDSRGAAHFLGASQFSLSPEDTWQSRASGARYPLTWKISVPSLGLKLTEESAVKNQELFSTDRVSPSYWEGAVTYQGEIHSQIVKGVGYLEMTGYAKALSSGAAPLAQ